ncbi:MAG: plasmid stabilization protein [Hyphomicrobiales bacterium]|nr:MAG: plasmid stabilization protein [Hyphomicrobiales bacterium]
MTRNFKLTPVAKEDLRSIWIYSFQNWGEAQADKYVTEIYNRFEWLADNPQIGKQRDDVEQGYFCFMQGSHLIFYICEGADIHIIGVLHKSMDVLNYFDS